MADLNDMSRREALKAAGGLAIGAVLPKIVPMAGQQKQNRPNIILIQCDQLRADVCRREGFPLDTTPFLDSLARDGTWFNKAYTASPSCVPSRTCLWTGRWPTATGIKCNANLSYEPRFKTGMDEVIKSRGYKMAAIGKIFHSYLRLRPAEFDYYEPYGHLGQPHASDPEIKKFNAFLESTEFYACLTPAPFPATMQQPYRMVSDAVSWINSLDDNDPFFIYLSINEPHNPYQVSEPYYSLFPPDKLPPLKAGPDTISDKGEKLIQLKELMVMAYKNLDQDLPRLRSIYYGMMRLIDDQIKRLAEFLKQKNIYDNTILIFISDHGDYVGEYGLMKKGAGVPECVSRIPMLWHGRGVAQHASPHPAHVSNIDIMPTLCDMLGAPIPEGVQGRSLWPMLTGQSYPAEEFASILVMQGMGGLDYTSIKALDPYKEGTLSRKHPLYFDELNSWSQSGVLRMLRKDDWKLVYDLQGHGKMYHIKDDPAELINLFGLPAHHAKRTELLADMLAWELRTQDPLPPPDTTGHKYIFNRGAHNYYWKS